MSEQRFYLGNNNTTICDRSQGGSDGFNMLTKFEVVDLLNEKQVIIEQQEQSITILKQEIADTQAILEMLSEKLKGWNNE